MDVERLGVFGDRPGQVAVVLEEVLEKPCLLGTSLKRNLSLLSLDGFID